VLPADRRPDLRMNPTSLVGQLPAVALYKGVQLVGLGLFSVLAPRYLGPELFGRFAVILSLTALWMTTSNLGARYVFGRFVPEYAGKGATESLRALFMHMVGSRFVLAAVAVPLLVLFLRRALPEASTATLLMSGAAFLAMTVGAPMFAIFYGLNRLGTSMGRESFGRFALLALLVAFGAESSLERASAALLATHATALAIGIYLCRGFFRFERAAFDAPSLFGHLRFGLSVFAANLLLRIPWRLGESALALADVPRAEIAFFAIALSAAVAFTRLLGETTTLQIPSLGVQQAAGDYGGRDRSLGLALKHLNILGVLFVLATFAGGPWAVRALWGPEFLGVVPNLLLVAPAVLSQPYVRTALSLAVIESRLRRNLVLGGVAVGVFVAVAALLVPRFASLGATAALLAASFASAFVAALQLRGTGVLDAARSGRHLLAVAPPAAILALTAGAFWGSVGAALLYLALLGPFGVLTRQELGALAAALRRRTPGGAAG
jgi:O-antigen/teichoic acid export membrane protein